MTFSEFTSYLKSPESNIGEIEFYTIPKDNAALGDVNLPVKGIVNITINKHNKKIINFNNCRFATSDVKNSIFILDSELANAYATKIQMIRRNNILNELIEYEKTTQVKTNFEKYSKLYPEIFV